MAITTEPINGVEWNYGATDNGAFSSWATNSFNATQSQQKYNAYQAALDRRYNLQRDELSYNRNVEQWQREADFQREMRDTSYSSTIKQLKAAGLNPYLAVTGGAAASPAPGTTSARSNSSSSSGARSSGASGALANLVTSALAAMVKIGTSLMMS